jgi:hypothetical protein
MLRTAPPHGSAWIWVLLRRSCVPLVYSVEHFPYTVRCRWHIDVAQFNTTVESVDDSVDDRRRGTDGASLARTLDAQWVGRRRHVVG